MGDHKTIECGSLSESDAVNFLIEKLRMRMVLRLR